MTPPGPDHGERARLIEAIDEIRELVFAPPDARVAIELIEAVLRRFDARTAASRVDALTCPYCNPDGLVLLPRPDPKRLHEDCELCDLAEAVGQGYVETHLQPYGEARTNGGV